MNVLLNKEIDEELKYLLASVATLSKKKSLIDEDIHNILNDYFFDLIMPFITKNYENNFKEKRNLLRIILLNYNYASQIDDYFLEEFKYPEKVQNLPLKKLLKTLTDNDNIMFYLIKNYFYIIFNDGLKEMIDNNEDVYQNIPWFNNWYQGKFEFVTTKLKDLMFNLRDYIDYVDTYLKDEIYLHLLKDNKDFFNLVLNYFNSFEEFNSYKVLLFQMLYLDSYLFLLTEEKNRELNEIEENIFKFLKEHIENKNIKQIPENNFYTLKMIDYFLYVNYDKKSFHKDNLEEVTKVRNLIKKKANKILLVEYY